MRRGIEPLGQAPGLQPLKPQPHAHLNKGYQAPKARLTSAQRVALGCGWLLFMGLYIGSWWLV
ncbi:MAG: hypothetical protein AAF515_02865 [Pseudomonadota bacterium]